MITIELPVWVLYFILLYFLTSIIVTFAQIFFNKRLIELNHKAIIQKIKDDK